MDIGQIIRDRAAANGVDPAVLARIAQIESNNNPNASAPGSSAKGLFQFTRGTAAKYDLADPYDPTASSDAAARLLKDNSAGLGTSDPGALYLAHFAGLGGAQKLIAADPSATAESVLGAAAVKANPFLQGMTVSDVRNWASRKMGGGGSPAAPVQAPTSGGQPAAAPTEPTGMLNSGGAAPQAAPADDGSEQALATLQSMASQQPEPPPQMQIATPPPRQIDRAALLKMIQSPLRAAFSLG